MDCGKAPKNDWKVEFIHSSQLGQAEQEEIFQLCETAYQANLRPYLLLLNNPTHLIVRQKTNMVGHACCIERWLQVGKFPPMRTCYVEAVATHPDHQRKGIGTALMQQAMTHAENAGFAMGGLSPACVDFYQKLGWERWQGLLRYRKGGQHFSCPADEVAMIYRLSRTPDLKTHLPLSIEWRPGEEIW